MNIDPQPQNGGCLWLLLVPFMVIFGFFGVTTPVSDSQPPIPVTFPTATPETITDPVFTSPHVIESVIVVIRESMPPQVAIEVSGYAPDGCEFPTLIEQRRNDETITVDIYRLVPLAAMCPAVIVPFSQTFELGTFEPGSYSVYINDFVVQFTI